METLKSMLACVALGVSVYAVYVTINKPTQDSVEVPETSPVELGAPVASLGSPSDVPPGSINPPDNSNFPGLSSGGGPLDALANVPVNEEVSTAPPASANPTGTQLATLGEPVPVNVSIPNATVSAARTQNLATTAQPTAPPNNTFANPVPVAATTLPVSTPTVSVPNNRTQAFEADTQKAQAWIQKGDLDRALLNLSSWYDDPALTPQQSHDLMVILDQLAGAVIYSPHVYPSSAKAGAEPTIRSYVVQANDTLETIAQKHLISAQLLANINQLSPTSPVQPGSQLKVLKGPFDVLLDIDQHRLTLLLDGRIAGRFAIGVGTDRPCPLGEFFIQTKQTNPDYISPTGQRVDKNDPTNPLGEHWIGIGNQFGIHGTSDPSAISKNTGKGCILLTNRDAEDVFNILSIRSRVLVRSRSSQQADAVAERPSVGTVPR